MPSSRHKWTNWTDWAWSNEHEKFYKYRCDNAVPPQYEYDWLEDEASVEALADQPQDGSLNYSDDHHDPLAISPSTTLAYPPTAQPSYSADSRHHRESGRDDKGRSRPSGHRDRDKEKHRDKDPKERRPKEKERTKDRKDKDKERPSDRHRERGLDPEGRHAPQVIPQEDREGRYTVDPQSEAGDQSYSEGNLQSGETVSSPTPPTGDFVSEKGQDEIYQGEEDPYGTSDLGLDAPLTDMRDSIEGILAGQEDMGQEAFNRNSSTSGTSSNLPSDIQGSTEDQLAYNQAQEGFDEELYAISPGSDGLIDPSLYRGHAPSELDAGYKVEHSTAFTPGTLFKTLWPEPGGCNQTAPQSDKKYIEDGYGGYIYLHFRRFIVVGNDAGHSICVPILTYNKQACTKRGVKPEKHGIVYPHWTKPKLLTNEPKLGFSPIKVEMWYKTEGLTTDSRVNYSKLSTIEHNFKVFIVGRIVDADSLKTLKKAVQKCSAQLLGN